MQSAHGGDDVQISTALLVLSVVTSSSRSLSCRVVRWQVARQCVATFIVVGRY